jgi:hypothetical protein
MRMEAARSAETLVPICESTRCHITEDGNLGVRVSHCCISGEVLSPVRRCSVRRGAGGAVEGGVGGGGGRAAPTSRAQPVKLCPHLYQISVSVSRLDTRS